MGFLDGGKKIRESGLENDLMSGAQWFNLIPNSYLFTCAVPHLGLHTISGETDGYRTKTEI